MGAEAREASLVLRRQERRSQHPIAELAARLRAKAAARRRDLRARQLGACRDLRQAPDRAASRHSGLARPRRTSRRSIGGTLALRDQLFLAVSQAGRSADIVETAAMAKAAGAITVAIVNDADSPLAHACDIVLPMQAGPELSVAASKSFIASLAVLLRLTAAWARRRHDAAGHRSPSRAPGCRGRARLVGGARDALARAHSVMTIGRGPTLAIAREAALKLKETCNLHAEAFSSAEFQHGPITLVEPAYPVLLFAPADQAAAGIETLRTDLARKGACVFSTGGHAPARHSFRPWRRITRTPMRSA